MHCTDEGVQPWEPSAIPAPPEAALPRLAALSRAAPSPLLQWQLVEMLYAYCATVRLYQGDWASDAVVSLTSAPGFPMRGMAANQEDRAIQPSLRACQRSIASLDAGILYTLSGLQGAAVAASAASAALEGLAESGTPPEPPASALLALTDCITRACMPALHGPGVSCALTLWCHKMIRDITYGVWSTSIQRRPHIAPGASL